MRKKKPPTQKPPWRSRLPGRVIAERRRFYKSLREAGASAAVIARVKNAVRRGLLWWSWPVR